MDSTGDDGEINKMAMACVYFLIEIFNASTCQRKQLFILRHILCRSIAEIGQQGIGQQRVGIG